MAKLFGKKDESKVEVKKETNLNEYLLKAIEKGVFTFDIAGKFTLDQEKVIKQLALELCKELDLEPSLEAIKAKYPDRPILHKRLNALIKIKTPKVD